MGINSGKIEAIYVKTEEFSYLFAHLLPIIDRHQSVPVRNIINSFCEREIDPCP